MRCRLAARYWARSRPSASQAYGGFWTKTLRIWASQTQLRFLVQLLSPRNVVGCLSFRGCRGYRSNCTNSQKNCSKMAASVQPLLLLLASLLTLSSQQIYDESWGYVTVRPNAHMFWWLYGSTAPDRDSRPLVMWLQVCCWAGFLQSWLPALCV